MNNYWNWDINAINNVRVFSAITIQSVSCEKAHFVHLNILQYETNLSVHIILFLRHLLTFCFKPLRENLTQSSAVVKTGH